MFEKQLTEIGLSASQAKAYNLLVEKGGLKPSELAKLAGESRTNAYMVLEKLAELGMAFKDEVNKKLIFRPTSPIGLVKLAEKQRTKAFAQEQKIKNAMPELLKYFHSKRTQPGVRFFQGSKGIAKMYDEFLQNKQDKFYLRTTADDEFLSLDTIRKYFDNRAKLGIHSEGIAPDIPQAVAWGKKNDKRLNRTVTYFPAKYYKAPVEISISGDQTCFISFGEEIVGVIIESPQIAEAMRQAFFILKTGAKSLMAKEKTLDNVK